MSRRKSNYPLRLDDSLKEKLRDRTWEEQLSMAELLRQILGDDLKAEKPAS